MATYKKITDVDTVEKNDQMNVLVDDSGALKKVPVGEMGGGSGGDDVAQLDWNNLENRPFYKEEVLYKIENQTVSFFEDEYNPGVRFAAIEFEHILPASGDEVTVIWDGETFKCKAFNMGSEFEVYCGNLGLIGAGEDTGEPFVTIMYLDGIDIITLDAAESHTVSVSFNGVVWHKLDERYLETEKIVEKATSHAFFDARIGTTTKEELNAFIAKYRGRKTLEIQVRNANYVYALRFIVPHTNYEVSSSSEHQEFTSVITTNRDGNVIHLEMLLRVTLNFVDGVLSSVRPVYRDKIYLRGSNGKNYEISIDNSGALKATETT